MDDNARVAPGIVPDAYLVEIGRITVQWGVVESTLDMCLLKLAALDRDDGRGMAIFAHMAFPQKLDILGAIIDHILPGYPRLREYKTVIAKLKDAQTVRNKVAHARWLQEDDGTVIAMRLTARGQIKPQSERVALDELRRYGLVIQGAAISLMDLVVSSPETIAERTHRAR